MEPEKSDRNYNGKEKITSNSVVKIEKSQEKKGFWTTTQKGNILAAIIGAIATIIATIIAGIIVYFFTIESPNVKWDVKINTSQKTDKEGLSAISINIIDEAPYIELLIVNDGEKHDNNLNIDIFTKNNKEILNCDESYAWYKPNGLIRKIKEGRLESDNFYQTLSIFPRQSKIAYKIALKESIKSEKPEEEFIFEVNSDFNGNWEKGTIEEWSYLIQRKVKIPSKYPSRNKTHLSLLFPSSVAFAANQFSDNIEYYATVESNFGGYNPFRIAMLTIKLIANKNIISSKDLKDIEDFIDEQRNRVGLDIVVLNKKIIDKLVNKGAITQYQKEYIDSKSRKAGGLSYRGYNVVLQEAFILDKLIENKKILKKEGQEVINASESISEKIPMHKIP